MKNFFKSLLSKKDDQNTSPKNNCIEFLVYNNEPNIRLSITEMSDSDARVFAQMICDIVHGQHEPDIINLLLDLSSKDEDIQKFITKILLYYSILKTEHIIKNDQNYSNDPVVKPTDFNKRV